LLGIWKPNYPPPDLTLQLSQTSLVPIGPRQRLTATVGASGCLRRRWAARPNVDPLGGTKRWWRVTVLTSTGRRVPVGSFVRVIAVPLQVNAMPSGTKRVFRATVGHGFEVQSIWRSPLFLELNVSRIASPLVGDTGHSVWVEPERLA
jgi:hypothetical protein